MLRALLFLTAIFGAADGTSAQELEGRLKQIYDTGIDQTRLPVGRKSVLLRVSAGATGWVYN